MKNIVLGNDHLRLVFDCENGSLKAMTAVKTGWEIIHVRRLVFLSGFYCLCLEDGTIPFLENRTGCRITNMTNKRKRLFSIGTA